MDPPEQGPAVVNQVAKLCAGARPYQVPCHTVRLKPPLVDTADGTRLRVPLRDALDEIRSKFRDVEHKHFGAFRFPRYELVKQLLDHTTTHQLPSSTGKHLRAALLEHLLDSDRLARAARTAVDAANPLKALVGNPAGLLQLVLGFVPGLIQRWRLRTRSELVGGEYHWFRMNVNNNRGAEADPDFFNQVKYLLDNAEENAEAFPEHADNMLVTAFLTDLQQQYRRGLSPWRGWARTVYPVLVLDGVSLENNGVDLLHRINASRYDGGRWDPLLVVAVVTDDDTYEALLHSMNTIASVAESDDGPLDAYRNWAAQFPGALQPYDKHAWFLFMSVVRPERGAAPRQDGRLEIRFRRRPLWTRGRFQAALAVACLVIASGTWAVNYFERVRTSCSAGPFDNADSVVRTTDPDMPGLCVGIDEKGRFRFGEHDNTADIAGNPVPPEAPPPSDVPRPPGPMTVASLEQLIADQNRKASDSNAAVATIVYLGPLTQPKGQQAVDGVRELAGVALAQQEWNQGGSPNSPQIRILLANAGIGMRFQKTVVDQIAQLADGNAPIVGVVGLGQNTKDTVDALVALKAAHLPVVATTNSSDEPPSPRTFFFQIAPTDRQEARTAVAFLTTSER